MPVEAACPSCEGKFRLPDAAAGKKIRCPKCKGPLEVPPLGAEPPAAPAVVTPPTATASPTPTASENLKTAWRSASQEPAPFEPPRKETPRVEQTVPTPPKTVAPTITPSKPATPATSVKPTVEAPKNKVPPASPFVPPTAPTPAPKPKPPEPAPITTPPAEQWFLKGEDGETFGPVDRATLDSWHDEGRMTADSQLLKHGTEQWQWASDVYPDLEEPEPEPETPPAPVTAPVSKSAAATAEPESAARKSKVARTVVADEDDDENPEEELSPHSKPVAFLLALTLGMFGIHRFYLGYVGMGLAMFFTLGGLWIWSITDALRILFGHVTDSEGKKLRD